MRTRSKSKEVSLSRYQHERYKWAVRYPDAGKRKASYFKLKKDAEAFQTRKEAELAAHGGSLLADEEASAVRDYRERIAAVGGTVREALKLFVEERETALRRKTVLVADAVSELLASKTREGKSHRYLLDLKNRLDRFAVDFGKRPISTVTTEKLDQWLHGLRVAPTTRNNFLRILGVLWTFSAKHGWCDADVAKNCEQAKAVESEVGILTPTETAELLNACEPELIPSVAIGAFAGLRRAEIERLDWSEVDLHGGHIEVKASKAKSARRRMVAISDNLKKWLSPHSRLKGPVMPPDYQARILDARERAGIHEWPSNALRHSYASYHLSFHQDAARLALELGHTNSALIFAHYREVVKPEDAASHWQIMPGDADEKVVAI